MNPVDGQASGDGPTCTRTSFISEGESVAALLYDPLSPRGCNPAIVVSPSRVTRIDEMSWLAKPKGKSKVKGHKSRVFRLLPFAFCLLPFDLPLTGCAASPESTIRKALRTGSVRLPGGVIEIHSELALLCDIVLAAEDARIKSTIALSPPIDIARYMNALREHSPSRFTMLAEAYGARPEDDPDYYRQISPIFYATRITMPVLLIHGTDDMVAPKENSEWMYAALTRNSNPNTRLELIPGAGHFFEHRFRGYLFALVSNLVRQWLEQTLGTEAPYRDARR